MSQDFDAKGFHAHNPGMRDAIISRLLAENAVNLTDDELRRTLDPCVGHVTPIATAYRDAGILSEDEYQRERAICIAP